MLDLETLGVVPGCVAFSIGAVVFDPPRRQLGSEFYAVVNVESCLDRYLREEEDTKEWWAKQSDEAKVALLEARDLETSVPLVEAMENFNGWQRAQALSKNIRLYGNGADFDNPILRCMYDAAGVKPYAQPYGGRCYRTLKKLDELFGAAFAAPKLERQGTYHNALDDAKSQAAHLMDIVSAVRAIFVEEDN
jgi:exodeoxyribonuclease VIII